MAVNYKLLEVDLTSGTSQVIDVTDKIKLHLGGRGLWNAFAWEQMTQDTDPLGPDNLLHVGVGPLTGIIGCKTVFSFKSPLTGWAARGSMSGYFGEEIVKAGYNAGILIKGKAATPSYLYVYDDKVEIRNAADLWGSYKQKTEHEIRERLRNESGQEFGVTVIGPAGENLVRFANATTEYIHSASKWGVGTVFGSKNLKAIAVRGTKEPAYEDHKGVWELFKTYATHPATLNRSLSEGRYGHSTSIPGHYVNGDEGIMNNHVGWHDICNKSTALEHWMKYNVWTDGCPGCAASCFVPYLKRNEEGAWGGEFRHDNCGGFNANIMVCYDDMTRIASWLDELGMDGEELGGLVAWAMDMYDKGIITKSDLGGIDLTWGNVDATIELMEAIAYRKGTVPALLAEGYRRAEEALGPEATYLAWEIHGAGCPTYDLRVSPFHWQGMDDVEGIPWPKAGRRYYHFTSHNGARMGQGPGEIGLTESATICNFAVPPFQSIWGSNEKAAIAFLKPVAGWDLTEEQLKDIMVRNFYLDRCSSLRWGYYPSKDDVPPGRFYDEPITDKYGKTYNPTPEWFEMQKKIQYKELFLTEEGLPPRAELERLGIDYVIAELDKMDAIG